MNFFAEIERVTRALYGSKDCQACKGIRFRPCVSCGQPANSFHDHREGRLKSQIYPTRQDWEREGERPAEQNVPERKLQP